jgi:hypothetical protein
VVWNKSLKRVDSLLNHPRELCSHEKEKTSISLDVSEFASRQKAVCIYASQVFIIIFSIIIIIVIVIYFTHRARHDTPQLADGRFQILNSLIRVISLLQDKQDQMEDQRSQDSLSDGRRGVSELLKRRGGAR